MTEKPQNVRMAIPADEEVLFQFLLKLYDENALFVIDEEKVRAVIRSATQRKGGIIGIIEGPSGIEGSVGMGVAEMWYSSDSWHLQEYWNFVREDCRQTNHAKDLIAFAKWCSDSMGIPLLMGIITKKRTAAKERLYRRSIPKVGAFFLYGAKGVELETQPDDGEN